MLYAPGVDMSGITDVAESECTITITYSLTHCQCHPRARTSPSHPGLYQQRTTSILKG